MEFRYKVKLAPLPYSAFNYKDKFFFIGSCFSEHMAERLMNHEIKVYNSSFGILFNPYSIANAIKLTLNPAELNPDQIIKVDGQYKSFIHHGSVQAENELALKEGISTHLKIDRANLMDSNVLCITLGSAWYYLHKDTNQIVANCHKVANQQFEKKLADLPELIGLYTDLINQITAKNPNVKIVFTVSPVKHLRDGVVENNVSKGILHNLIYTLKNKFSCVHYFESFEIQNDELRDYRFYTEDFAHPNELAIKYIWNSFTGHMFDETSQNYFMEAHKLYQLKSHRVILQNEQHQDIIEVQKRHIAKLFGN